MIQLHYYPSNASIAPHILLEEMGVRFELKLVDRARRAHKSADYLKLNPNGLIPVLVDGDLVLYETAAIVLHLVDSEAGRAFAPPVGTAARAHFYKWLVWFTNTVQATQLMYFDPENYLRPGSPATSEVKEVAQTKVGGHLKQMDDELARHRGPWMLGHTYSALDIYAFMLCRWTRAYTGPAAKPAREHAHLGPFLQRMLDRPAVQRVIAVEQLQPPIV